MAVLQNPLSGMKMDEQAAAFIGVLERRTVLLTAQELRFRALLEALTGEPWDDQYTDLDQAQLDQLVENSLMKSLGVTKLEAAKMVRANKARANKQNIPSNGNGSAQ
jgi:hypothetical protein